MEQALRTHTLPSAYQLLEPFCQLPRKAKISWKSLLAYLSTLEPELQQQIIIAAQNKLGNKRKQHTIQEDNVNLGAPARKRTKLDDTVVPEVNEEPSIDFLRVPSDDVIQACIAKFIDSTNNSALRKKTCIVCARNLFPVEVTQVAINRIPNKHLLEPTHLHPAQRLIDGALFHTTASTQGLNIVCNPCLHSLVRCERPKLSISNNLWLGDVPFQLQILTLPEQLLISLYFPCAYIVKVYPKNVKPDQTDVPETSHAFGHKKLRGNVSTFRLPTSEIADMVEGLIVPKPSLLLSAVIGVTFVGVGKSGLKYMSGMFKVRRKRVHDALLWLKNNNRLYSNVTISQERLNSLPDDDVPPEILEAVRFSDDVAAVGREHAGYVPADEGEDDIFALEDEMRENAGTNGSKLVDDPLDVEEQNVSDDAAETLTGAHELEDPLDHTGDSDSEDSDGDARNAIADSSPAVFPLQTHGVVDVGGDNIPDSTLFAHAVENIMPTLIMRDYGVRKGSAFVNEFGRRDENHERFDGGASNPNHLLGAFPTLFPYGLGGFEVDRPVKLSYEEQVKWALQHSSGRFRRHTSFIFQVFGVLWKRQVCRSAALHIEHDKFVANYNEFMQLTPKDLLEASEEENHQVTISNPAVRLLRKHITTVRAKVIGTDENRVGIRAQIWGMTLKFNPPTLWTTINLSDTNDPIAQVLAGQDIDLDNFIAKVGPNASERALVIGSDPFAAAEYFHLVVRLVLSEMIGITVGARGAFSRKEGIFGFVNGYIGTVEAQARGSLHLHILFWLQGAPTASKMQEALKSEEFRAKIRNFIQHNIRADIPATEKTRQRGQKTSIAYSRPQDPRLPDYNTRCQQTEQRNASVLQAHECNVYYCLKNRKGKLVCKRGHPWPIYAEDWVDSDGNWGPKRLSSFINAWNPPIFAVTRSNMDIKLLTNSWETKDIAFYITLYIAKKQVQAANASAILATSTAFAGEKPQLSAENTIQKINKKLLQQCSNTLSRQYELSGPEVVSYLMGWGDRYISHTFVKIYWDGMTATLRRVYPHIVKSGDGNTRPDQHPAKLQLENGKLVLQDQMGQYADRGETLQDMCLYDFFLYTYHDGQAKEPETEQETESAAPAKRRGRPPSERHPYLARSERKGARVVRGPKHETALHFVGRWLPSRRDENQENYSAQVLLLLKPWRVLDDLRGNHNSFLDARIAFESNAKPETLRIIANLEYYHECSSSAYKRRNRDSDTIFFDENSPSSDPPVHVSPELSHYTEEDVVRAREQKFTAAEQAYGKRAMDIAYSSGLFDKVGQAAQEHPLLEPTSEQDSSRYREWEAKVAQITRSMPTLQNTPRTTNTGGVSELDASTSEFARHPTVQALPDSGPQLRSTEQQQSLDMLNAEQRRAHDIVENHLRRHLRGESPEQLLMIIQGEGGTGKTVVLQAITHTFDFYGARNMLAKTGTTGISASLVAGQTLHAWAGIPVKFSEKDDWLSKSGKKIVDRRRRNILPTHYLIIDEFSMLTKKVLAQLSYILGNTKAGVGKAPPSLPFGAVCVILVGDPHQFPPVGNPKGALFNPACDESMLSQMGLAFYRQFTVVVTLTQQNRVKDHVWNNLLKRLREGECTEDDIDILKSLTVRRGSSIRWDVAPWNDAVLVTPRHSVRTRWNMAALERHRTTTGNTVYISRAEDSVGRTPRPLTLQERVIVAGINDEKPGKLAELVEIAIGMKAMVLWNIATEADLANGTRGIIEDIKLDPREPTPLHRGPGGKVVLRYPPCAVFIKIEHFSFPSFEGLPPGVLPLSPTSSSFSITTGPKEVTTINRRQFALTPGYAFTDYKSQGQTIAYVVVDLEQPPHGRLTPFNAYVALSRSHGRDTIRLLRGLDPKVFTTHPSEFLREEDKRLAALTAATRQKYP